MTEPRSRKTKYPNVYKTYDDAGKLIPNRWEIRVAAGKHPITQRYIQKLRIVRGSLTDAFDEQTRLREEQKRYTTGGTSATLNDLCERYLVHAEATLSPNTVRVYRLTWESKIKDGLGTRIARGITADELDLLFQAYAKSGLKGQTVNRLRAFLGSAYRQGVKWRWCSFNPVESTTCLATEDYRPKPVSYEDIKKVLDWYAENEPMMADLLQLTMLNQLRRGEVCALKVSDYDAENETLTIQRTAVQPEQKGGKTLIRETTKTHQDRVIDLDSLSVEILNRLVANKFPAAFLFSQDGGKTALRPNYVTQSQRRVRDALGVFWRVHDLRSFTTTMLLEAGVSSKVVQLRGGWREQGTMLKHYNRPTKEASKAALNAIVNQFGKEA